MIKILAAVLILVGGWLIYAGYSEADSIAGKTRTTIVELKNQIDGKSRTPRQYFYYGAGALLIIAGAGVIMRK